MRANCRRAAACLSFAVALSACSSALGPVEHPSMAWLAGRYGAVQSSGGTVADTLVLRADGTATRLLYSGSTRSAESGMYTLHGDTVVMIYTTPYGGYGSVSAVAKGVMTLVTQLTAVGAGQHTDYDRTR